jgi:chaperonin GroES
VKIRPLRDRIVVTRISEHEPRVGHIIIPDTAKEKPQQAVVLAVGSGRLENGKTVPLEIHVGDQILIGKYAGTEITVDGGEFLIVREDEVLGVADYEGEPRPGHKNSGDAKPATAAHGAEPY